MSVPTVIIAELKSLKIQLIPIFIGMINDQ